MNKNKFQKGFTLIELLVVIAIIGILAAVLLVNLAGTRNSARDTAARLEMSQLRTAMESYYGIGNTYTGGFASTEVARLLGSLGPPKLPAASTGLESASAWCRRVGLYTGSWCVDSAGYGGAPASATDCAGSDFTCN